MLTFFLITQELKLKKMNFELNDFSGMRCER